MQYRLRTLLIVLAIALLSKCLSAEDDETATLVAKVRLVHGHRYKCAEMARIVNHLRKQGKDGALRLLRLHADRILEHGQDEEMFLICRCLFENPQGWKPPPLGRPEPEIPQDTIKQIPFFPLMFSKGVPFFAIEGYYGGPTDLRKLLAECEPLKLKATDLPLDNYDAAAQALVASEAFKQLYPDTAVRKAMSKMILLQAANEN